MGYGSSTQQNAGKGSSSRCCNVARTTTRIRKQRTELAKRSIKFGLARFPLNRSVPQKENESLSGKKKSGSEQGVRCPSRVYMPPFFFLLFFFGAILRPSSPNAVRMLHNTSPVADLFKLSHDQLTKNLKSSIESTARFLGRFLSQVTSIFSR